MESVGPRRRASRTLAGGRETTTVLAVDPGKRSGCSWATIRGRRWTRDEVIESWKVGTGGTCEVTGPTEAHRAWAIVMKVAEVEEAVRPTNFVVVVEDFRPYPGEQQNMSGLEPMRLIAIIDFIWTMPYLLDDPEDMLWDGELPELVKQMAGERGDITVAELRRLGLYRTKGQGGGKDSTAATQHLLHYVKKRNELLRKDK